MTSLACPLCSETGATLHFKLANRQYFECGCCDLLFTDPDCMLHPVDEKKRYEMHYNDPADQGYLEHLSKLSQQLIPLLQSNDRGIDFGCGASSVLGQMIQAAGFEMESYDPFFGPQLPTLVKPYDFLTCTEVVEHFKNPCDEFPLINSLVKSRGYIAIMTNLRTHKRRDPSWWYLRDQTHRCFYSEKTFKEIAKREHWNLRSIVEDVVIFQK